MQKLKNIEFIRVILMFGIVMLHSYINRPNNIYNLYPDVDLFAKLRMCFYNANNGVDAFFIIAGLLLVLTFKNKETIKNFILKKYIRLTPVIAFSMIIILINWILKIEPFNFIRNIASIFLLNTPLYSIGSVANGPTWFTSALFINLLIYFCIIKFVPEKHKYKTIGIMVTISYLLLTILRGGNYATPTKNIYGFLNIGTLRAIGGIGIGCFLGFWYKKYYENLSSLVLNIYQKLIINFIEIFSFIFILWWSFCPHIKINNIVYIVIFTILLILFILKKGFLSNLTEKDFWVNIGKYQYSIFIMHVPFLRFLYVGIWKNLPDIVTVYPWLVVIVNYLLIVSLGVLTYHFVEKPSAKYLSDKLNKN